MFIAARFTIAKIGKQPKCPSIDEWIKRLWHIDPTEYCVRAGLLCGSVGKESPCKVGDLGSIPGLGRSPGEEKGYPLPYPGLENSMDCIYSPWGPKESDTTERPSLHSHCMRAQLLGHV